jgi:hypothetical protein
VEQRQFLADWQAQKARAEKHADWIVWGSGMSHPAIATSCRGLPPKVNMRNRRMTKKYEHDAQSLALGEWAELSGIPYNTLFGRIRYGWTLERAITEPVKERA